MPRSYALCLFLVSSLSVPPPYPWILRCSKLSLAAPWGECHWEVGTTPIIALSASFEVDRGPLSLLVRSSLPGGTNELTVRQALILSLSLSDYLSFDRLCASKYVNSIKPTRLTQAWASTRVLMSFLCMGEMRRPRITRFSVNYFM